MIGHLGQILADNGKQGIGIQMCTHFEFAKCSGCLAVTVETIFEGRNNVYPHNLLILKIKIGNNPFWAVKEKRHLSVECYFYKISMLYLLIASCGQQSLRNIVLETT